MVETGALIKVEVVYAQPQHAIVAKLALNPGSTVADALQLAGEDAAFASIDLSQATLGIYGLMVTRDQTLNEGDRIEIYRPLAEDPKSARRSRARARVRR